MAGFGAFCNWLAAHDYIAGNPFADMYLSVDKARTNAKVFTADQLKVLFASPLFTGCKDEVKWHEPGEHQIRDHRYWLPHLMMYSGARPTPPPMNAPAIGARRSRCCSPISIASSGSAAFGCADHAAPAMSSYTPQPPRTSESSPS